MLVKLLFEEQIEEAIALVKEVFTDSVAPFYDEEGIEEFKKYIAYENLLSLYRAKNIIFFGAYEEEELCGISCLTQKGHIVFMFVKQKWQLKGIGRKLFEEMSRFCVMELQIPQITVNAAPGAVASFERYGMKVLGFEQKRNGIRFVPMGTALKMFRTASKEKEVDKLSKKQKLSVLAAALLGGALLLFILTSVVTDLKEQIAEEPPVIEIPENELENTTPEEIEGTGETEEASGLDAIPEYVSDEVSYTVSDQVYQEQGENVKKTILQFEVHYPQLEGLPGGNEEAINELLKSCAMESVEEIYLNPSEEIKERVLMAESPVVASMVEYKISYQSETFMSILFQDHCYAGTEEDFRLKLRTMNINLTTGEVYEVADIVELEDGFIDQWAEGMRKEAENEKLLNELTNEEMIACLSGTDDSKVYTEQFFVDANGLEIGLSFDYEPDDKNDQGFSWVTAPFSFEELEPYRSPSSFWGLVLVE